jgi:hypothetical protein
MSRRATTAPSAECSSMTSPDGSEWQRRYDDSVDQAKRGDLGHDREPWERLGLRLIIGLVGGFLGVLYLLFSAQSIVLRLLGLAILIGTSLGVAVWARKANTSDT